MVYSTGNSQLQPLLWSCVSGKVHQGSYILSFNSRGRQCTPCISYFAVLYSCTDVDTSHTADFIVRVRRCELWPSKVVGCGMVYLNQELSYVNHRWKLQAPLSYLETIDEDSVLEFLYEEPEEDPTMHCAARVGP